MSIQIKDKDNYCINVYAELLLNTTKILENIIDISHIIYNNSHFENKDH